MAFQTPVLREDEIAVLALIDQLREDLRDSVAEPRRWFGTLRRMSFARAVQGSNSIEGYDASLDDVVAAVEGEPTLDADTETQFALAGYRDAMTYVLQVADDETLEVDEGLLKSLHFMMLKHDLTKNPGRWRPGAIYVRRESSGEIVYEGPPHDEIPRSIAEMLAQLDGEDDCPVLVKAAMAHLNLVLIHPFSDGNGRMARCLQTLVLARDRVVAPTFSSIEEFLGRNTAAYYEVLADVGEGSWHPQNDPRPWVRFCMRAHYIQARTFLRRRQEAEALWNGSLALATAHGLPERCAAGLMDAAYGLRLRRGSYQAVVTSVTGEEISNLTASRDLKAMTDSDLLNAVGETRGRYYVGGDQVEQLSARVRKARPPRSDDDPFALVRRGRQLSFDAAN
ncbi:MAG: Fic family protein [Gaiellaceae bacterium MAG52_C11]|nr:Fic family protein [Candidatus Gaiellasilicea maunaloa]